MMTKVTVLAPKSHDFCYGQSGRQTGWNGILQLRLKLGGVGLGLLRKQQDHHITGGEMA